jgi:hypothetical protein
MDLEIMPDNEFKSELPENIVKLSFTSEYSGYAIYPVMKNITNAKRKILTGDNFNFGFIF